MRIKLFFSFLLLFSSIVSYASTDFDIIMQRIQLSEWASASSASSLDNSAKTLTASLQADGSWPDIDYKSTAQVTWSPVTHLTRLKTLVLAYTRSTTTSYNSSALYQKIVSALNFWYTADPRSTNWYKQEITCPQLVGTILILMRSGAEQVPSTLEKNLLDRMASIGGSPDEAGRGVGANKVEIATHWIYRGCLTKNSSVLSFGVQQVYYSVYLTTDQGLQHDYSYFFNGQQFYTGGYGVPFIKYIARIANFTVGTQYEIDQDKLNLLVTFTRDHFLRIVRGKYFLYNTIGRDMSKPDALNPYSTDMISKIKNLDPENASIYDAAIKRLNGTETASYQVPSQHTHYWRGDYTLYSSPNYNFDVRLVSTRTCRNENGNGENLKGYFMSDGANAIAVNGDEYLDIFPVWDWAKIPGVTAPQKTSIPLPPEWGNRGTSTFAGGVSTGTYGVTTYYLNDQKYNVNTTAKKSWFMFGNEIVCLGAGIKSTAAEQINTTLNQCLLNGNVVVKSNGTESTLSTASSYNYNNNVSWIYHNKVGYFFPKGGDINLTNKQESGAWVNINKSFSSTTVYKNVFKLWFNHGTAPTSANYAYIIVPGNDLTQIRNYDASDIEILVNSDSLQVVHHKKLNMWGMVFYKAASFKNSQFTLKADRACALMLKDPELSTVHGWLSDPSQSQTEVKLRFVSSTISSEKELAATMPATPYAGSTIEFLINSSSSTVVDKTEPGVSTGIESVATEEVNKLTVPNPVRRGENVRLGFMSVESENIQLNLHDLNGRDIISDHYSVNQGENEIPVETSSLNSGLYIISVQSKNKPNKISEKLLIK